MKNKFLTAVLFSVFALNITGCGYTQKTTLPNNIKTIYVDTVKNQIPIDQVFAHEAGVEIKITNAIIRRLNLDGNLKVVNDKSKADAFLDLSLIRFEQEGQRFTSLESVSEYRLFIALNMRLLNPKTEEIIWEEPNFSGDADYFVSEIKSIGRSLATDKAIDRLARNVVDRIVEDW